jgi:CheY-like chemotaxis protein
LLVEDVLDNQRLIGHVLRKAGADVSVAENGQVAVDLALAAKQAGSSFDIILMDIQMPVMDGYEATRQLRKAGYADPIIALTANATTETRQKCIEVGCDDYMTKPLDISTFTTVVAKHLLRKEPSPKFAAGSQVRVKKGVTAPSHTDMSLGGWCGKVYDMSGTVCLVHWNEATLQAIHANHREQWQGDGVDFQVMWLQENVLETDPGGPLCIEQSNGELRSAG